MVVLYVCQRLEYVIWPIAYTCSRTLHKSILGYTSGGYGSGIKRIDLCRLQGTETVTELCCTTILSMA